MSAQLKPKSILEFPRLLKIPEFIFAFIIIIITQYGTNVFNLDDIGPIPTGQSYASQILGIVTIYGFMYVFCVQVLALPLGERSYGQDMLHAIAGFFFYLAVGCIQVNWMVEEGDFYFLDPFKKYRSVVLAQGSMCILMSFLLLIDAIFSGLKALKG